MRVLIVEDEPAIREFLQAAFDEEGEHVLCVGTFAEGRAELLESRYDLLLADVVLPDGSGADLIAIAAAQGVRPILMSGEASALRLLDGAHIDYLRKPFLLSDLYDVIRRGGRTSALRDMPARGQTSL